MALLKNVKSVIDIASDGLFSDEFELDIFRSMSGGKVDIPELEITNRVMVAELPTRNSNTQEASLRGIPIVRRGRTTYAGQATFTFLENLQSKVDAFFQDWFDKYEKDGSGSKSPAKEVFLDFVLTQYMPDRNKASRQRRLYYCLPVTYQSMDGGHQEKAQDIARATLTVHYTVARGGMNLGPNSLLEGNFNSES
jgi:hypothetical protein